jgi:hypothetical protein
MPMAQIASFCLTLIIYFWPLSAQVVSGTPRISLPSVVWPVAEEAEPISREEHEL